MRSIKKSGFTPTPISKKIGVSLQGKRGFAPTPNFGVTPKGGGFTRTPNFGVTPKGGGFTPTPNFGVTPKGGGFTLIELLVVIAIISLLSSIAYAALGDSRAKARDATRLSNVRSLATALQLYAEDHNGQYPNTGSGTIINLNYNSKKINSPGSAWTIFTSQLQGYYDLNDFFLSTNDRLIYDSDTGDNNQSYGAMIRLEHPSNMPLVRDDGGYFYRPSYYSSNPNSTTYYEFGDQPKYCLSEYASFPDVSESLYPYERSWIGGGSQNVCGGGN